MVRRIMAAVLGGVLSLSWCATADAQWSGPPSVTMPLADPVVQSDVEVQCQRSHAWREGVAHQLLLERDVSVTVGSYGFRADQAVVQIHEEMVSGRPVRHVWMLLENARALRGKGPTTVESPQLLVTTSTTGQITLVTDLLQREQPEGQTPLTGAARDRFGEYLATISQPPRSLPAAAMAPIATPPPPVVVAPTAPSQPLPPPVAPTPLPVTVVTRPAPSAPEPVVTPTPAPTVAEPEPVVTPPSTPLAPDRILPPQGSVAVSFDRMVIKPDGERTAVMLFGHVGLMFMEPDGTMRMSLSARNAVVFLDAKLSPGGPTTRLDAEAVQGVYLEDEVIATDGQYTIRSPRVFYDPKLNKALVLDAVLYTWDQRRSIPLYVRAREVMQHSRQVWEAREATLTTSDFAKPHFAISARRVTVAQKPGRDEQPRVFYVARDIAVKWQDVPLLPWPKISGYAEDVALRSLDIGNSNNDGMKVRTRWDLFALTGAERPDGVELSGRADYRGEHGPAVGLDLSYDLPRQFGQHAGYLVAFDQGDDNLAGGREINHDGDQRGHLRGRHRQYLDLGWELSFEYAYVSDPSYLQTFFPGEADSSRQYETSIYLKKQDEDHALTFKTSYDLSNFTTQTTTLQSIGYTVDKVPELQWFQVGTSLWDNRLTWFAEMRASRMRIHPGEDSPSQRGLDDEQSLRLLGQRADTDYDIAWGRRGVPLDYVTRLDTRQELAAPMKLGTIDVVPYVAGRVTFYDHDFEDYRAERDSTRLWGEAGIRLHTQFHRLLSTGDNRLFDLHQLRHIVEPSINLSLAGSSLESEDLPVFDPDVEALREGANMRFGLRNTLQTQRGGPGRWYSVDWITLDTDLVMSSDDAKDSPQTLPEYFGYRPEYSRGGDHVHVRMAWMITDALAFAGDWTHDLDDQRTAQWRAGITMIHTPNLTSFVNFSEIDLLESRLLQYGFSYAITRKYDIRFTHTIDLATSQARWIDVTLVRKLPGWRLLFEFEHDQIDGDQSFFVTLVPVGIGGSRRGVLLPAGLE